MVLESVNFHLLSTFATAARRCGVDLNQVLHELNVDIDMSPRPQSRISLATFSLLLDACQSRASKSNFAMATGASFNFEGLPELGAFVTSAPTLRETFKVFKWSPQLLHPNLYFSIDITDSTVLLTVEVRDPTGVHQDLPALVELSCSAITHLCAKMLPGVHVIRSLEFKHQPLADLAVYAEFFTMPLRFGASQTRFVFDLKYADLPLPGGIPVAHIKAEQVILGQLLVQPAYGRLSKQLTQLFRSKLSLLGEPMEAVAQHLELHPRTLQRRLKAEGSSFADIQSQTRHELACEMLKGSVLDIESISIKLGYSDRRSFTNAFIHWQGQSPREYRSKLTG